MFPGDFRLLVGDCYLVSLSNVNSDDRQDERRIIILWVSVETEAN